MSISHSPSPTTEHFSIHVEPVEQGGEAYWRCENCGWESIELDEKTNERYHADYCSNPEVGQ